MKNLFLAAALVLGLAVNAQTPATQVPVTTQTTPSTAPATAATVAPATTASADQEKEYTKVQQAEIAPEVLKEAVAKYQGYSLVEALKAEDGSEYKLVLTKDGKDVAAYYKNNGEFIKEVAA
ncbi:hypothetical protein AMR72_09390 [Flavobacterium psychrophilum]|nr:hypothetical protein AMR72_09390 [Flavobacterium psychrophilum]AOE52700.1 hypothetical protein ALW18_09380 [Flavobacterium psychrophilum]